MPAYLVQAPQSDASPRQDEADMCVVFAEDETDAKAMAKAKFAADGNPSWDAATVTELTARADLENYRLRVRVSPPPASPGPDVVDVTYTGLAAEALDDLCDGVVVLLNATSLIAGAAYDNVGNVLTVAETTDGLGDHSIKVEVLPPASDFGDDSAPIVGFVGVLTHEGAAGAALTAAMAADTHALPELYASGKRS